MGLYLSRQVEEFRPAPSNTGAGQINLLSFGFPKLGHQLLCPLMVILLKGILNQLFDFLGLIPPERFFLDL